MKIKSPSINMIVLFSALFLNSYESKSQSMMHVLRPSSSDTSITVLDVSKITFETGQIHVSPVEGDLISFGTEEASNILFDLPASSSYEANANNEAVIYPNPASDLLYLESELSSGSAINVFDSNGKLVAQQIARSAAINTINIGLLSPGLYIIEYGNNGSVEREKFLKK